MAAFTTWFWGVVGTVVFLFGMGRLRGSVRWRPAWVGLSLVTLALWAVAAVLGITLPVARTGNDPTQIPFAAFSAPAAAAMLTALENAIVTVLRRGPGAG